MQLFLIRHLETALNKQGILQGKRDVPIMPPDEKNQASIEQNKDKITSAEPFDLILCSDFQRTRMTAEYYGYNQHLTQETLMNELDFGDFEGKLKSDLIAKHGVLWFNEPENLELGEPLTALGKRVQTFLDKYQHHNKLLVFGHGAWIRALYSIIEHGDIQKMNQYHIPNNLLLRLSYPHQT